MKNLRLREVKWLPKVFANKERANILSDCRYWFSTPKLMSCGGGCCSPNHLHPEAGHLIHCLHDEFHLKFLFYGGMISLSYSFRIRLNWSHGNPWFLTDVRRSFLGQTRNDFWGKPHPWAGKCVQDWVKLFQEH
jgi:hypothetical protein